MKRKIGDKVRIKDDLIIGEYYGTQEFFKDMSAYKDKEAIIEKIDDGHEYYLLDIDGGYDGWTDEMLEDVEEENVDEPKTINVNSLEYLARKFTPQRFSSHDGRFSIEAVESNCLELTITSLQSDQDGYMQEITDDVQQLEFHISDLDTLIGILQAAKQIEVRTWEEIKKQAD